MYSLHSLVSTQEKIQSQKMYIEAMKADRDNDNAGSVRSIGSWVSSANSGASMIRRVSVMLSVCVSVCLSVC